MVDTILDLDLCCKLPKISSLVKKFFCDNKKNITKFQNPHEKGKKEV